MATYKVWYADKFGFVPTVIKKDDYKFISADVKAESLEGVFRVMNVVTGDYNFELPLRLRCRSMCVGDIVEDESGQHHIVDVFGFKPVEFQP